MQRGIETTDLMAYSKAFETDANRKLFMNAIVKNGVDAVAFDYTTEVHNRYTYSIEIKTGSITNQKASGRCWLFAGLNMMRWHIMKKCNLETFELSQNYQMFWDKFEKSNSFLNSIIETAAEETDSRIVNWLLQSPVGDGGQWDMFKNLVKKYGVVPKTAMPETFHSGNTGKMNWLITLKLREDACTLRTAARGGKTEKALYDMKDAMMKDIYYILCQCLGKPPASFDFEYRDKDEAFVRDAGITALEFTEKYFPENIDDYVSIISAPTADKPYSKTYTVKFLGNVADIPVKYLNVDIEAMKLLAIKQLEDGEPVWFGCDVGKWLGRENGIMDLGQFNYGDILGVDFKLGKADRLDYCESLMTHAMVFLGANLIDGKPNRWKVENSWGDTHGDKGYYVMADSWFNEYMYQVVVNRKYLSDELKAAFLQEPIELKPWDPMGSLA